MSVCKADSFGIEGARLNHPLKITEINGSDLRQIVQLRQRRRPIMQRAEGPFRHKKRMHDNLIVLKQFS